MVLEIITPILESQTKLIKTQEERIETLEKQVAEQDQTIKEQERLLQTLKEKIFGPLSRGGPSSSSQQEEPQSTGPQLVPGVPGGKRRKRTHSTSWKSCVSIMDRVWAENYNRVTTPRHMQPLSETVARAVLEECQKPDLPCNRQQLQQEMVNARGRHMRRKHKQAWKQREQARLKAQQEKEEITFLDGLKKF